MSPYLVLFTEDSGKRAGAALEVLVRKLAVRVEPAARPDRIEVVPARGESRAAMQGHRWRSTKDEALRRALVRDLATRLRTGDFVVFHHDGDTPWTGAPGSPAHDAAVAGLCSEVEALMGSPLPLRFLRLVPHYSVESWLYTNVKAVERLVEEGAPRESLDWLARHADERGGFDHVDKPKHRCPLHDRWNLQLAQRQWSARRAAAVSPSWAQAESDWKAVEVLRTALLSTTSWAGGPEER